MHQRFAEVVCAKFESDETREHFQFWAHFWLIIGNGQSFDISVGIHW
jgi:hypothetical protein